MNITVDVEIDSPKKEVWCAIIDTNSWATMISGIIDLKIIHQPETGMVGLKWSETRKMFGKEATETMWITDCVDEEYYCTRAENSGAIYTSKLSVAELNNKTILTMSFSGTSDSMLIKILSSIMGIFINKSMRKMLEKDLTDIKEFVEQKKQK